VWGNDSDAEYKKGYSELMAHTRGFNCFQLQELEEMVDKNIAASPIGNTPYVKGVKEGLRVMKVKLNMPEVVPVKVKPSELTVLETVEKNSHILKLIDEVNMKWKRQKL